MSFIGDFLGTIAGGLTDKYLGTNFLSQQAAQRANDFNAQQAQMNRDWQYQMMQQQNEYNSPVSQMQRARDAGLNPSLLYGNPIQEAASPSGGNAATGVAATGANGANDPIQYLLLKADLRQRNADALLKEEQARTEDSLRQARFDNLMSTVALNQSSIEDNYSKIQQRLHQNALTDAERNNISFEQMYKNNQLRIDWQRIQNETKLSNAEINKLRADTELSLANAKVTNRQYDEMIYTFAIRKAGLEKQNLLTDAQIRQADATAKKLGFESNYIQTMTDVNSPKALRGRSLSDMASSSGAKGLLGQTMLAVDYLVDNISGILIK